MWHPNVRGRRCLAAVLFLAYSCCTAQAASTQPGGDYRLPGKVIPEKYVLKMVPYLEKPNFRYTGSVDITISVLEPTSTITLHAHKDLTIGNTTVTTEDGSTLIPVLKKERDEPHQFLKILTTNALAVDKKYIVSIAFEGDLLEDNYGFYLSSYEVDDGFEYMATTHFEATSARKAFPCFDEPTYRATFQVSLAKLDDQIALSNMPPIGQPSAYDPSIGNRRWVHFEKTPKMPTYLVAFVVSKLTKVPTSNKNINIYVRPDAVDDVKKPAAVVPKLLTALETFVGSKYPLPKLDLVAIPDFPAGAMENWGLITFKEDMLLVTEGLSTEDRLATSLRVIAHEFAHLWFGDLVTLKWWNTIWQQEGMAAFLESYILDLATDGDYDQMLRFGTTRSHSALLADSLEHSPPLTKDDIETPDQIEDHFGTITYSKGSNVHYMIMWVLGKPLYQKALLNYTTTYREQSTTIDDFAQSLEAVANDAAFPLKGKVGIPALFNSWGRQPGYPVLTILRDYSDNTATVSQARFLAHEPAAATARDSKWSIPFAVNSLYDQASTFTDVLLDTEASKTIELPYQLSTGSVALWINSHQSGFYRVNYDLRNWLLITKSATSLDAAARASLLDDMYALDRAGQIDSWIPLHYMQTTLAVNSENGEHDIAPWTVAAKMIRGYAAVGRGDPEFSTYFQTFTAQLVKTFYGVISWSNLHDTSRNSYRKSVLRDIITQLACDAGLPDCRKNALKTYQKDNIDANIISATLCENMRFMDEDEFSTVVFGLVNVEDVTARTSILGGLGCTRDADLVQMLLRVATAMPIPTAMPTAMPTGIPPAADDIGLSSGESLYLLKSIMDHSADGCDTALSYVYDNYDNIDAGLAEVLLMEIAQRIYSQDQLKKINELKDKSATPSDAMTDLTALATSTLTWVQNTLRERKEWVAAQIGVAPARAPFLVDGKMLPTVMPPTVEPHPTEPPKVSQEWLLPDNLEPLSYALDIVTQMGAAIQPEDYTFSGKVAIKIKVNTATSKIVLHRHSSLEVTVDGVMDASNAPMQVSGSPVKDEKHQFFTINLARPLTAGAVYTVSLTFSGPLQKDLEGLYLSSYDVTDAAGSTTTKYLAVTQFEQTSARKAFPCFDEPKYRATFDITITKLKTQGALSNTEAIGKPTAVSTDTDKVTFKTTPAMPTYLVALLVSELKEVKVSTTPKISIWVREGAENDVGLASELAPKVLKKLEELTGIDYVLDKLDLAAIPDFAPGAMENWGLITFKDTVLRVPKNALAHRRFNCARDITHEFSHLWFGDLVTNNWWSSLWQQEGMAAFMEAWVLDQATDYEYDAVARQSVDRIEQGLMDDALETAGPITNHTVGSPDEINEHAGEITYNKGAGFLRMIRAILGESTMWKGLRQYLANHAYSTAGPDDLAAAFQDAATEAGIVLPVTIKELMDSWTTKKGYPVLDVERYLHDGVYKIKQSRFLSYEPENKTEAAEQWIVPYNCEQLYSEGAKRFDKFLQREEQTVALDLDTESSLSWIICNTEQEGFYRVNYDISTYGYLSRALGRGFIKSGLQRGVLYDDALTMLRARKVEPYVVLNLLQSGVPGDLSYPVWGALSKGLNYLRAVLAADTAATSQLNQYVGNLTAESFASVDWYNFWGWEELVQTNEVRQILTRLACDAGEELCTSLAEKDYAKFTDTSKKYEVHQENFGAMLCVGGRDAVSPDTIGDLLLYSDDYDERVSIAYAMGCARNSAVLQSYFEGLLQGYRAFHSNEVTPLVESAIAHGGETVALKYITDNWAALKDSLGESKALELLQLAAEHVHTEAQYKMVETLVKANTPSIYMTVAERSAAHGLKFAQNELGQVKDFLAAYVGKLPPMPTPSRPTEYRLPGDVMPINYAINLVPSMEDGDFSYMGSVVIRAHVTDDYVNTIVLHKHKDLKVVLLSVMDLFTLTEIGIDSIDYNEVSEMYSIKLERYMYTNQDLSISMQFENKLQKDKLGFYLSEYPDGNKWKYIATTQFEQTYARKAFPCFDEPKYRATFDITITRRADQRALSNMPLNSTKEDPANEGKLVDTFNTTPPMPTYLVAFIVSELEEVKTSDPRINLYVRPGAVADAAFAAEITPKILAELEKFTGVDYYLPKLDLVGVPDFYFGAMENWGLCTFRENRLLYTEGKATTEYKIYVAEVIAHELAHLWFGDYVTLDWWSSGWLKEGMAEFLEYVILDKVFDDDEMTWYPLSRLSVDDVNDGMFTDSLEHVSPLTDNTVLSQDQISEHMGLYTYTKGAGLQNLLMGVLGEDNFKIGLNNYLKENALGTGTPEKFAKALQEAADAAQLLPKGVTILGIINSWSTKPGLPVVTLIRNFNDNTVNVAQKRYLALEPQEESTRDGKWIVPISIYFSLNTKPTRFTDYLTEDETSININMGGSSLGGSIFGNSLQSGYYYTNYDILSWIRIGSSLMSYSAPKPIWRAGVIRDAFALSRASLVDPWMPMFILEQDLSNGETAAAPWQAAYEGLRLYSALAKNDAEADQLFQTYLRTYLSDIAYGYVGWDSFRGKTDGQVARDYVSRLACYARNTECRTKALQTYYAFLNNEDSVDPNTLAASLCEGLSHGSELDFSNMYAHLQDTTERSRRMTMVYALGCVQNATLVKGLLKLGGAMDGFEPQEVRPLFRSILDNSPNGVDAAVDYVFDNFDYLAASLGQSSAEDVVLTVADKVHSDAQYEKLYTLSRNNYSPRLEDAVGLARANLNWAIANLPVLKDYWAARVGIAPELPPKVEPAPDMTPTTTALPNYATPTTEAAPTPGPGPTEPPETMAGEWRLPSAVSPVHYSLMMVPFLEPANFTFVGRVEINVRVKEATKVIVLHAVDLDIDEDDVSVVDAATADTNEIDSIGYDEPKGFIKLYLTDTLVVGSKYNISISFSGDLRTDNFGFYVSSYVDDNETKYMATTHFEATSARKAFPCFDEPRFRALFDISVARFEEQTALSNMPRKSSSSYTPDLALGGRIWDDFETTPSMPTYLVAFMVHELTKVATTKSNINIWVRPSAASQASLAAQVAPQAIKAMEDYIGVPMPVPKADLVAIPTFPIGAMENWGLATFREDYLINPSVAKSEHAYSIASVIQHELSHFWFGDLVTIDWWSVAWLKEGMASLLELYMLDKADGAKYSAYDKIVFEHVHQAMVVDARESADVLTNFNVASPDEISAHMSTITYSKGGSFLRMLMTCTGEPAFQEGLQKYITSNAYYWGTPMKLASAMELPHGINGHASIQALFDSWTRKQGYPVVTLVRDRLNGIGTITQERFLSHEPTEKYNSSYTWVIPYNVWVHDQPMPTNYSDALLEVQHTKTILLEDTDYKLVLLNAGQTGYYRVNYDLLTWIYVNIYVPKGVVTSAAHRAALIDDSFNLALVGKLDAWVPMSVLASTLPTETDLSPWIAARDAIFRLRAILGRNEEAVAQLDSFVLAQLEAAYGAVDWDSRWPALEKYDEKLLRDVLSQLACTAGSATCQRSADFDFEGWYYGTAEVNPDTLSATLCEGFASIDSVEDFAAVWARFLTEQDPTVRQAYLYGFGCVTTFQSNLLAAATTQSGIKSNEVKRYVNSFIAHVPEAVDLLLTYVDDNFDEITESVGVKSTASILQLIAERITMDRQLMKIANLVASAPSIDMTVVGQTAKMSLKFAQDSLPLIVDYLQAYAGEEPPKPSPPTPATVPPLPTRPTPHGDFRLPAYVAPDDYQLRVVPYLSGEKQGTFDGQVSIKFHVTENSYAFTLHSLGLAFNQTDIAIVDGTGKTIKVTSISESSLREWVSIELGDELMTGQTYTVKIAYSGIMSSDLAGLYMTSQDGRKGAMKMAVTRFAPTYARRVFPCFDEPAIRATFTLTVGRLDTETVISNTPVKSVSSPDASIGGRVLVTFETTARIPAHSVTLVVAEGVSSVASYDRKVTVYGTDKLVDKAQDTLTAARSILKSVETITGTPSGLDNLALVGVKDLAVEGTDNWAIDIIRENAMVNLDASPSAGEAAIYYLTTLAHRISQHWFGNLVSMAWWDNVWITDGFATYFQYRAADLTEAGSDMMLYPATFSSRVVSPALALDSMESVEALNNQHVIGSTAGIEKSINDITALKGGAIVNSLPYILGSTAFESGLKTLFDSNHLSGVLPSALYAALQSGVDKESALPVDAKLDAVVASWVDNAGYPVVNVIRNYDADTATLSQERFLLHSPSSSANMDGAWWVPVSFSSRQQYVSQFSTTPIHDWIEPSSTRDISLPAKSAAQWLIVNLDRKGFYRVNYDAQNWQLLALYNAEPGNHALLEIPTRVMLLDDALTLARTGRLDYATAVQYADYLRNEYVTHEVFATARNVFGEHLETFLLGTKNAAVYKTWVQQLLAGAVKYFDYTPKDDDNVRFRVARSIVMEWACDVDVYDCVKPATADFYKWLEDTDSVPHDLLASTVCAGVKAGDMSTVERAVTNLDRETNDVYRKAIIRGLGCADDDTARNSLLKMTTEAKVLRGGEALEVFKSVTRFGPASVDLALDFLSELAIEVERAAGTTAARTIVATVAGRVTTKAQYKKLQKAVGLLTPGGSSSATLAAAMLLATDNLAWHDAHLDEVGDLLYSLTGAANPDLPPPPTTTTTTTMAPTMPTGPVPSDPATATPDTQQTTWFTLPPTKPTSPITLPPLPDRPTSAAPLTDRPTQRPTQRPTAAPTSGPGDSTTPKAGAAGVVANVILLLASLLALQRVGAAAA